MLIFQRIFWVAEVGQLLGFGSPRGGVLGVFLERFGPHTDNTHQLAILTLLVIFGEFFWNIYRFLLGTANPEVTRSSLTRGGYPLSTLHLVLHHAST
jgi:hypothetical protein